MKTLRALLPILLATGCGSTESLPDSPLETDLGTEALAPLPSFEVPTGCNPIAHEWDCMLPYPWDGFVIAGQVALPEPARPQSSKGQGVSLRRRATDGFSTQAHMLALFGVGIAPESLEGAVVVVSTTDPPHRPRVLVELDPRAKDPTRQALVIRPLERLRNAATDVVGIAGLKNTAGADVSAPMLFGQIRDHTAGAASRYASHKTLHESYEATVFPALAAEGIPRESLQLAWSFTTQTREVSTADMFSVREQMLAAVSTQPPPVAVTSVEEPTEGPIGRKVVGEMTRSTSTAGTPAPRSGRLAHRERDHPGAVHHQHPTLAPRWLQADARPALPVRPRLLRRA